MDLAILNWIQDNLRCGFFDQIIVLITSLGNGGALWLATGLLMMFFKSSRRYGMVLLLSLLLAYTVSVEILQPLVGRVRPFVAQNIGDLLITAPKHYSFPSGHTASSFAAATAIALWNKRVGIVALVCASLIAFSRLYLYVHYPSDVLVGVLIGIGSAFLVRHLYMSALKRIHHHQ